MADDDTHIPTVYRVVVNGERQHAIWPAHRQLPPGWREGGPRGPLAECLARIDRTWTDMRPLTLRETMAAAEQKGGHADG